MLGFTFRGRHCSELGICMKSKNRMLMPEPKLTYDEALDMDGNYDFSAVNSDGRVHYSNRQISVDCYILRSTFADLRSGARDVSSWLGFEEGTLAFDDEPDVYYKGRVSNRVDFTQAFKRGYFTLVFECRPFAFSTTDYSFITHDVTDTRQIRFTNFGVETRPEITITGTFQNPELSLNGRVLKYNGSGEGSLILNCADMVAILGTANVLPLITGDFLTLRHGMNIIVVRADSINADVGISYVTQYI